MASKKKPAGLLLDPESERIAEAYAAIPSVKKQTRGLLSLDPQQDQSMGQTAFEMLASFIPGVGQALAARDIERARRANDPAAAAMAATEFLPFARLAQKFDPVMSRIKAYHGTADDFDVFDPAMGGKATGAESGRQATWFTDDPTVAKGYAAYAAEMGPYNRKIKEVEKIEKMLEAIDDPKQKREMSNEYYRLVREAGELEKNSFERRVANARLFEVDIPDETKMLVIDAKGKTPYELSMNEDTDSWLKMQLERARKLKKQGVQIKNLDDAAGLADAPATHYALFDPSGVKILDKKKLVK